MFLHYYHACTFNLHGGQAINWEATRQVSLFPSSKEPCWKPLHPQGASVPSVGMITAPKSPVFTIIVHVSHQQTFCVQHARKPSWGKLLLPCRCASLASRAVRYRGTSHCVTDQAALQRVLKPRKDYLPLLYVKALEQDRRDYIGEA